jgi:ATP-binding cassette subfamily B protein
LHYKHFAFGYIVLSILTNSSFALISIQAGNAFNVVVQGRDVLHLLLLVALTMLGVIALEGVLDLTTRFVAEILSKRLARDAREELYISLLGKSQTFHNRQRVGDIMARASNDMSALADMVSPGIDVAFDSFISTGVTLVFIAFLNPLLLLVPALYTLSFFFVLRNYSRRLSPVSRQMREEFGQTNAVLNEAVAGIEVVKATAQEQQEVRKFVTRASLYRDYYVKNGRIQGSYLPPLMLGIALTLAFLYSLYLVLQHQILLGTLIAFMGLMTNLRYITFNANWSFNLIQLGIAGAGRILELISAESELDENEDGHQGEIQGDIVFEHVTFSYGTTPVLKDVSFHARPGQTIAIVGQTGAGKSTLTKLVNRIYDVEEGRVLVDGVDVREWNLDSLRSQISTIEQDVFLFSRTIAENIGYGLGPRAERAVIESAAHDAQADEFIRRFPQGYETEIGERGVTLSGGQRQRLAIARALLTDPRILILDDSTSAIDSATEDEIQQAIRRVLQGRTTLLITHRLSQIRWADSILVMRKGELIDQGTHEELLARCDTYRRIFSHYDAALPSSVAAREQ